MKNDILANRFNFKKVDEDFRKKYQLQELGNEIIAGKKCTVYTLQIDKSKIKYFIWKNIPLSFELEMDNKKILSKLINLDENPSFSKSEFDVPKNIIFEEMSLDKEHTP
jgi:outer membrane lipoprotein-sorting protein